MVNPFDLLREDDSGDEGNVKQTPVAAKAPAAKAAPATNANKNASKDTPRGKPDYPQRGAGRRVFQESGAADNEPTKRVTEREGRGRGGGRGPRGGRGGRGSGGNRVFDRHSQTGRTDSDKQEHQAWGGDEGTRELADENAGLQDARNDVSGIATPVESSAPGATTEDQTANESPAPRAEEPEDNTKTYQEYLTERSSEGLGDKLGSLNLRKANEGADDSQWKNAVPLSKDDDDENYFGVAAKERQSRKKPTKEGKTYLEVEARFSRPQRGGRGGDRGSDRGQRGGRGRGRGGARPTSNGPAVNTEDKDAFPSLS